MRNAIVMYSSITGNTEKVAQKFAEVLKAYNFKNRKKGAKQIKSI